MFAVPYSQSSLRGSNVISKLSKNCGAKNPENLTSTKLRKQVATVAQILNLSDDDIEQLATFLGHSKDVHQHFYRLSESTFQVAKVSKLLLMMEKGQGQEFRGKTLDEININVNSLVSDEDNNDSPDDTEGNEDKDIEELTLSVEKNIDNLDDIEKNENNTLSINMIDHTTQLETYTDIVNNTNSMKIKKKHTTFVRTPWSKIEKEVTTEYFKKHLLLKRAPNKNECEELKKIHPQLFKEKPWKKIKTFIHNMNMLNK